MWQFGYESIQRSSRRDTKRAAVNEFLLATTNTV